MGKAPHGTRGMRELFFNETRIADDAPCFVIAEIGNNHGGDPVLALKMAREAERCGASAVKFQRRDNASLYASHVLERPYENENSYGRTYGEHREALELQEDFYWSLPSDVTWFATAFDESSAEKMYDLDVPAFKIHSGGLTDEPLLKAVASYRKPVIVSTGGGTWKHIDRAHELLQGVPHAFLHCTASYPLKPEEANLRAICTMRERYPTTMIGFSSHSPGITL